MSLWRRLGAVVVSAASLPASAADCVTEPLRFVLERFVPAECPACWRSAPPPLKSSDQQPAMAIDWLVPGTSPPIGVLASAALPEAAARARRAGGIKPDEVLSVGHPLPLRESLSLRVADGVAWNGYMGISLHVVRAGRAGVLPQGLSAYVALVEKVPACEDGTLVERRLVRTLVGPLALTTPTPSQPVEHRMATRVPDMRQPERLTAVAWIENPRGQIVAAAPSVSEQCGTPLLVMKPMTDPCK
jgi:hypothetical protein